VTDPPILRLPEPALVVLVGAAGAGKSTLAARWFAPGEILSSDAFREVVAGDPADQSATRSAFGILHQALVRRLAQRRLTVVDATNVRGYARQALVRRAAVAGIPAFAIVLDLPPALVLGRNAVRDGRRVPTDVVTDQLRDLQQELARDALEAEGFATVIYLRDPGAVDAFVVERGSV
jgi:predicted kinase